MEVHEIMTLLLQGEPQSQVRETAARPLCDSGLLINPELSCVTQNRELGHYH